MIILFTLILKIIILLQILIVNKILITNKINNNKNGDELIKKFIEPKAKKLFKLRKSKSKKLFKS